HSWRSQEMAILVGENTIITDNPRLNTRLVAGKNPLRIIINTQQKLNEKSIVFTDGNPTILFSNFEYNIDTETNTIISITDEKNVVKQVLNYLYQHEINSLIVEGGAYTLNEFIANNLWDEARILHGVNELKQGIKAPKIEGIFTEEYKIGTDTIKLLKNAKA
ncbi:MAG: RibD family protein, partial [Bacteroidetes bacterium]|nr:RibD family protein [Bacteroidota bacterium]